MAVGVVSGEAATLADRSCEDVRCCYGGGVSVRVAPPVAVGKRTTTAEYAQGRLRLWRISGLDGLRLACSCMAATVSSLEGQFRMTAGR